MKRFLKSGLVVLFLLLMLFGGMTLHTVSQSQHYSRLVNYVGIVRGATQRLVKLELMDQPSEPLIEYLDGILKELETGDGEYGLPLPKDSNYQQKLAGLSAMWEEMKVQISAYRNGLDDGTTLLSLSEVYFKQANDTVFCSGRICGKVYPGTECNLYRNAYHHAAYMAVHHMGLLEKAAAPGGYQPKAE